MPEGGYIFAVYRDGGGVSVGRGGLAGDIRCFCKAKLKQGISKIVQLFECAHGDECGCPQVHIRPSVKSVSFLFSTYTYPPFQLSLSHFLLLLFQPSTPSQIPNAVAVFSILLSL